MPLPQPNNKMNDPEDMMDNGIDEAQEDDAPPLMGRRAMLQQSLSGPMTWNPSIDNPAFDGNFTDATATPPKPVQYGSLGGSIGSSGASFPNDTQGSIPPGTPPSTSTFSTNPQKPGQDFQQKMSQPDVKSEMIAYLAQKARARASQAAAYQSQSMSGQRKQGGGTGSPSSSGPMGK
jgi:hypothetical protein